jgi:hypothetical protein
MNKSLILAILLLCLSINAMAQNISIDFYGTMVEVPMDKSIKINMKGANENEFDRAWRQLSRSKLEPTVLACQNLKNDMNLNGWAMFKLASKIGDELVKEGVFEKNEATVLMVLLCYSC